MKSFIMFLNRLPEHPKTYMHDIQVDINCLSQLYEIYKKDNGKRILNKILNLIREEGPTMTSGSNPQGF